MTNRQRKSPRRPGFNYATDGIYFITICTQNRLHLFGHVQNSLMCLNAAGGMIVDWWDALPHKYSSVTVNIAVVMPNHTHALIGLDQREEVIGLSTVVQWFKTMTTNAYIHGVNESAWEPFEERLWQRSYHDRIVRDKTEWERIRRYIISNPALWEQDTFFG